MENSKKKTQKTMYFYQTTLGILLLYERRLSAAHSA